MMRSFFLWLTLACASMMMGCRAAGNQELGQGLVRPRTGSRRFVGSGRAPNNAIDSAFFQLQTSNVTTGVYCSSCDCSCDCTQNFYYLLSLYTVVPNGQAADAAKETRAALTVSMDDYCTDSEEEFNFPYGCDEIVVPGDILDISPDAESLSLTAPLTFNLEACTGYFYYYDESFPGGELCAVRLPPKGYTVGGSYTYKYDGPAFNYSQPFECSTLQGVPLPGVTNQLSGTSVVIEPFDISCNGAGSTGPVVAFQSPPDDAFFPDTYIYGPSCSAANVEDCCGNKSPSGVVTDPKLGEVVTTVNGESATLSPLARWITGARITEVQAYGPPGGGGDNADCVCCDATCSA